MLSTVAGLVGALDSLEASLDAEDAVACADTEFAESPTASSSPLCLDNVVQRSLSVGCEDTPRKALLRDQVRALTSQLSQLSALSTPRSARRSSNSPRVLGPSAALEEELEAKNTEIARLRETLSDLQHLHPPADQPSIPVPSHVSSLSSVLWFGLGMALGAVLHALWW